MYLIRQEAYLKVSKWIWLQLEHESLLLPFIATFLMRKPRLPSLLSFVSPAATGLCRHRCVTIVTVFYITCSSWPNSCCLKWGVKYHQIYYIYFFIGEKKMDRLQLHFSKPEPLHYLQVMRCRRRGCVRARGWGYKWGEFRFLFRGNCETTIKVITVLLWQHIASLLYSMLLLLHTKR